MSSQRSSELRTFYCFHCKSVVPKATFYRHRSKYFINGRWKNEVGSMASCLLVADDDVHSADFENSSTSDEELDRTPVHMEESLSRNSVDDIYGQGSLVTDCFKYRV